MVLIISFQNPKRRVSDPAEYEHAAGGRRARQVCGRIFTGNETVQQTIFYKILKVTSIFGDRNLYIMLMQLNSGPETGFIVFS